MYCGTSVVGCAITVLDVHGLSEPALLEREGALDEIARALAHARQSGEVMFVVGAAGIGKTAVLQACIRSAEHAGFRVASAVGSPMEAGLPFGLIGQAIVALGGSGVDDPVELARLGGQSARLYRMYRWLIAATADTPLLLALDDLHWADPDSLELLGFLCRRLIGCRMLAVGCLRPEPDPAWLLVRELAGSGKARMMSLSPLSPVASATLLQRSALDAVDRPDIERMVSMCAGTPLLLKTAAANLNSAGRVPKSAEAGSVANTLLIERFAGGGEDAFRYVQAASILGVRFQPEVAGRLAELHQDAWEAAHLRLVRSGLVGDLGGGWSSFVHPLFARALLDSQAPSFRERAHARAFRLLVERGAPDGLAAEHAVAGRMVGNSLAIQIAARAGRSAAAQGALLAACSHLGRAVELADGAASDELLSDYASALAGRALIQDAERVCGELLARADVDAGLRGRALSLLAHTAMLAGRPEEAERRCADAASAAGLLGPEAEAAALVSGATVCNWVSPLAWTRSMVARALAVVPPGTPARRPLALLQAITALMDSDPSGEELLGAEARAIQDHRSDPDPSWAWTSVLYTQGALMLLEDLTGSTEVFEREFELAVQEGAPLIMTTCAIGYSDALTRMGRAAESLELLERTLALTEWRMAPWSDLAIAVALTELGRDELAEHHIDALRFFVAGVPDQYYAPIRLWLCVLDGRRLLAAGERQRASDVMMRAAVTAKLSGWRHPLIVPWAGVAIRAHLAAGHVDRATEVIDDLNAISARLSCRWPHATVLLGQAQLAAVAGRAAEADHCFGQALAVFAELPMPVEHAEALIAHGSYLRRTARPRLARAPLARALELAEHSSSQRVARLARAELAAAGGRRRQRSSEPNELTGQEQRVADFAAQGLTNTQIAAALALSPKTVGHYLERIYAKLGVRSRRELFPGARQAE